MTVLRSHHACMWNAQPEFPWTGAEFVRNPEQVLDEVYTFVGVERAEYCPLPAGMQVRSIPICSSNPTRWRARQIPKT